jgi:hypothetical protein
MESSYAASVIIKMELVEDQDITGLFCGESR